MRYTKTLLVLLLGPMPVWANNFFFDEPPHNRIKNPVPSHFTVCYNYSCKEMSDIGIKPADWQQVRKLFKPAATNAVEERRQISKAVALMAIIVGRIIGTENDKGGDLHPTNGNDLDCIDVANNTTVYLTMMQKDGLFHFHTVQEMVTRGWFIMGYPHTTAAIRETKSGVDYVVDSWFHDNGVEPEILTVKKWYPNWHPPKVKHLGDK